VSVPHPYGIYKKNLVQTQLHYVITKKDLPHLIISEGDILIDTEYQNFLIIYTDGSKDPQNNTHGCAFVIPELKVSKGFKLQSHMSIFMCELTAIFLALNWIQDFKPLNTVIFVDSLSALQAIKGSIYKVKNSIIYDIYNIFTSLSNIGINVILEWIPSHVGILGNEIAGKEAKLL
jgi:kelch-like protein 2/3